jgi:hypothetical protein
MELPVRLLRLGDSQVQVEAVSGGHPFHSSNHEDQVRLCVACPEPVEGLRRGGPSHREGPEGDLSSRFHAKAQKEWVALKVDPSIRFWGRKGLKG